MVRFTCMDRYNPKGRGRMDPRPEPVLVRGPHHPGPPGIRAHHRPRRGGRDRPGPGRVRVIGYDRAGAWDLSIHSGDPPLQSLTPMPWPFGTTTETDVSPALRPVPTVLRRSTSPPPGMRQCWWHWLPGSPYLPGNPQGRSTRTPPAMNSSPW